MDDKGTANTVEITPESRKGYTISSSLDMHAKSLQGRRASWNCLALEIHAYQYLARNPSRSTLMDLRGKAHTSLLSARLLLRVQPLMLILCLRGNPFTVYYIPNPCPLSWPFESFGHLSSNEDECSEGNGACLYASEI